MAIFSKRHYEALAEMLRLTRRNLTDQVFRQIVWEFAIKLEADNPAFDRSRFYIACGVRP